MQPEAQKQNDPDARERTEATNGNTFKPQNSIVVNPIERVLPRLQNVRQHGEAWRADCPCGHGHAKGSLTIATGDDGRVLLHCFVGCQAADVATAVGLHLADLFPKPVTRMTMEERRRARNRAREADWAAALGVLGSEATLCEVALTSLERGEQLGADDVVRIRSAIARIHAAREVLQ